MSLVVKGKTIDRFVTLRLFIYWNHHTKSLKQHDEGNIMYKNQEFSAGKKVKG